MSKNNGRGGAQRITLRALKAYDLRLTGMSYRNIGTELKVSRQTAFTDVMKVMEEIKEETRQSARHYRDIMLASLDELQAAAWTKAVGGNQTAILNVMRIMERRAKLLGIDAPIKVDIEGQIREFAIKQGIDPDRAVEEGTQIVRDDERDVMGIT